MKVMGNIVSLLSRKMGAGSFESVLAPHLNMLYRQAYKYTGNGADAEDLLQDLLVHLYSRQKQLHAADNLAAWLARCLYHRFVDLHRQRKRIPGMEDIDSPVIDNALSQSDSGEAAYFHDQILSAMTQLTSIQRAVLSLHDIDGYTLPELVDILDCPLGTLKSHLHRARKRLKSELELQPIDAGVRPAEQRQQK